MKYDEWKQKRETLKAELTAEAERRALFFSPMTDHERIVCRTYPLCEARETARYGLVANITIDWATGRLGVAIRPLQPSEVDFLPLHALKRLVEIRRIVDEYEAGTIDALPEKMPWEES